MKSAQSPSFFSVLTLDSLTVNADISTFSSLSSPPFLFSISPCIIEILSVECSPYLFGHSYALCSCDLQIKHLCFICPLLPSEFWFFRCQWFENPLFG